MNASPEPSSELSLIHQLQLLVSETAGIESTPTGLRLKIFHMRAFPWDDVAKTLLYRNYTVLIVRKKADFFIEASRPVEA
jgi:hypothetical protein